MAASIPTNCGTADTRVLFTTFVFTSAAHSSLPRETRLEVPTHPARA